VLAAKTFVTVFTKAGQSSVHSVRMPKATNLVRLVTTSTAKGAKFAYKNVTVVQNGRVSHPALVTTRTKQSVKTQFVPPKGGGTVRFTVSATRVSAPAKADTRALMVKKFH
jgi:hypothetical protein